MKAGAIIRTRYTSTLRVLLGTTKEGYNIEFGCELGVRLRIRIRVGIHEINDAQMKINVRHVAYQTTPCQFECVSGYIYSELGVRLWVSDAPWRSFNAALLHNTTGSPPGPRSGLVHIQARPGATLA